MERRGGEIVKVKGTSRVQGVLGVSRALGDRDLKEYITAEPEVFSGLVSETSEFLILGTDGLWDVVGNMEATDVVARAMAAASGEAMVGKVPIRPAESSSIWRACGVAGTTSAF